MRFLFQVEAAVSAMHIETSVRKFLDKFFKEYDLPMPKIKIVNSLGARWLGRTVWNPNTDATNTTIEFQKRITEDQETLDRIVAHELIHHWEFLRERQKPEEKAKRAIGIKPKSHGKSFFDMAEKINAIMGKDYVTEKSNQSYVSQLDKEYFLLVQPSSLINKISDFTAKPNRFGYAWFSRPNPNMKELVQHRITQNKAKVFKSKDDSWLASNARLQKGGIAIPVDKESQEQLKQIYETGKEVTL